MNKLHTIKKAYERFGQGDMPGLLKLFSSNIEWRPAEGHPYAPEGKPWIGTDVLVTEFFNKIGGEWASFGCSPARYHEAEDKVIVEGRYFGVHKKTGKKLDAQFCHIWTLEDGKVTIFQQYVDTAQLQEVTGMK